MKLLTCAVAISVLVGTCCSAHVSLERKQDSYVDALQDSNNQGKHTGRIRFILTQYRLYNADIVAHEQIFTVSRTTSLLPMTSIP